MMILPFSHACLILALALVRTTPTQSLRGQRAPRVFRSRRLQGNSGMTFQEDMGNVGQLMMTEVPSVAPSSSPSVSLLPTSSPQPTVSAVPTASYMPTIAPTLSSAPTVTPVVTVAPSQQTNAPSKPPTRIPTTMPSVMPSTGQPTVNPTSTLTTLPTFVPSGVPSEVPSVRPSNVLTDAPSVLPSESPTQAPSSAPVVAPSSTPTGVPSDQPSFAPTRVPTFAPSSMPSRQPSRIPTTFPSSSPSLFPSDKPSSVPSLSPTEQSTPDNTSGRTLSPSASPTDQPSSSPTPLPTARPTRNPTPPPTPSPTARPTRAPTPEPTTRAPTPLPTTFPSSTPSLTPTNLPPTRTPSVPPSPFPTRSPSSAPTGTPTVSPAPTETSSRIFVTSQVGTKILLNGVGVANRGRHLQTLERCNRVVTEFVAKQVARQVEASATGLEGVQVEFNNVVREEDLNNQRIVLEGDLFFQIISRTRNHDFAGYVRSAFDSPSSREAIVFTALASDCPEFANVVSAELEVESQSQAAAVQDSGGNNASQAGIYAGLAAVIMASAILVGIFVYNRYRDRSAHSRLSDEIVQVYDDNTNEYASEIGVNTLNEVSTLGDPIPIGLLGPSPADHSTQESNSLDYDFKRAYQDVPSISEVSGSQADLESLSQLFMATDDDTLGAQFSGEEVFEISAPPGLLGLVLETNRFGVPTVNNIKPSSVLADQVRIGDRLLSVDDQDVTIMQASEVSRFIASKKKQRVRKFVFSRPSRFDSEDDSFLGSTSKSKDSSALDGHEQTRDVYRLKAGKTSTSVAERFGEGMSEYTLESNQNMERSSKSAHASNSRSFSDDAGLVLNDDEDESVHTMLNPHTVSSMSDVYTLHSNDK